MKHISNRLLPCITFCLLVAACEGPTAIMSGGALSGTDTDPPAVWQFAESSALAQLETRPQDPYSINLVYVQIEGELYIYAGDTKTNWVQHIEQTPMIRLRVDETIYPLCAVRVQDRQEFLAFAEEWANRSAFSRDPRQIDEVWLYRLESRDSTLCQADA